MAKPTAVSLIFVSFRRGCAQEVLNKKPACEASLGEKRGLPLPRRAGEARDPDLPGSGGRRPERVPILARARGVGGEVPKCQMCVPPIFVSVGALLAMHPTPHSLSSQVDAREFNHQGGLEEFDGLVLDKQTGGALEPPSHTPHPPSPPTLPSPPMPMHVDARAPMRDPHKKERKDFTLEQAKRGRGPNM